ncbi:MAG: TolC family protein, partial [Desulfovibrio sp.]|nr:TolC family protein [Desulfovibrio sp.]
YQSARATLREARAGQAEAMNVVRTGAETAWINTQNAREQYSLTASGVALARENLKLKSEGFGEGLYTALDVTQARDQLLAAEVERRVAAFQFVVNYALLHLVSGTMPDFLKACTATDIIREN